MEERERCFNMGMFWLDRVGTKHVVYLYVICIESITQALKVSILWTKQS
jgi:hypothetical protein